MELLTFSGIVIGMAVLSIVLLMPAIASFSICVPKWWESKVQPSLRTADSWMREHTPSWSPPSWLAWPFKPFVWLWIGTKAVLTFTFMGIGKVLMWYYDRVAIFVKQKCPYTVWHCEHDIPLGHYCYKHGGLVRDGYVDKEADPPRPGGW